MIIVFNKKSPVSRAFSSIKSQSYDLPQFNLGRTSLSSLLVEERPVHKASMNGNLLSNLCVILHKRSHIPPGKNAMPIQTGTVLSVVLSINLRRCNQESNDFISILKVYD